MTGRGGGPFVSALAGALVLSLVLLGAQQPAPAGGEPAFRDPGLPIEARVSDLVSRMTLEEKVGQLLYASPAIERLGVPAYNWWNEALHGVARAGRATVFPQAIGLAATWDIALVREVASVIGDEARAKHHDFARRGKRNIYQGLTFWSPNINIFRDPRWGRGMETYGEDPWLVGQLGVAFVQGLQGDDPRYLKAVATPKHYAVHSGPEPDRHTFDARVDERDLRETYLPHFEAAVREGGAWSVMCAYNRFMGDPACASRRLLGDILRREWGFAGYVVSDCDAVEDIHATHKVAATAAQAAAMAVRAGCDLNCGETYKSLTESVARRLVSEAEIDTAARRLFTARFRLGMFDPPERVAYAGTSLDVLDSPPHRDLALRAARESIVLLKNADGLLPLRRDLATLAVIGPNADDEEVLLGNYNGTPTRAVTPLAGLREKLGSATRVLHARGAAWAEGLPALDVVPTSALRTRDGGQVVGGLKGEYFANETLSGAPVFTRVDPQIDFRWFDGAPDPRMPDDDFAIRWTGELVPPVTGTYQLGGFGVTGFRVYLDERLIANFRSRHSPEKTTKRVELKAGTVHRLRVEFFDRGSDARFQLVWSVPGPDLEREALEVAKQADAVVLVLGLSPRLEGEEMLVPVPGFKGGDRVDIGLPAVQERLLRAVHALDRPTVLVLLGGSALACDWAAEHVGAVVEAWYPGQAAGTALADVLFGDHNPAGRLPVTFYRSVAQLPPFADYHMRGRTYRYFAGDPLYPFGYGLSYTRFSYRGLAVPDAVPNGEPVQVSVEVENVGTRAGDEVVQVYVTDVDASVPVPLRSLQGVARLGLQPGERRTVRFEIAPRQLSLLDASLTRVVEPGVFEIAVGGRAPGPVGRADTSTTGLLTARVEITGPVLRLK